MIFFVMGGGGEFLSGFSASAFTQHRNPTFTPDYRRLSQGPNISAYITLIGDRY